MKYCTIAAGALGLTTTDLLKIDEALGKTGTGLYNSDPTAPHVVWLPGQACTGCTMALTNSVFYTTVGSLVLNDINLDYSETLAAASGDKIVESAISTIGKTMVFVAEGAIPHGGTGDVNEKFCTVWSRSGGIIAAGSKLYSGTNPTVYAAGTLVGTSSMTIDANSIIAAGSELVEGTTLPAGTVVESAGDRAVMKAAPFLASFNTSISSSYGTDRTNANIKITGTAVTVVGDANAIPSTGIEITGGTDASNSNGQTTNQGSILAGGALSNGTFLSAGTIVTSSFDRLYLSAESATVGVGVNTDVVATFQYAGTANDWKLTNNLIITNTNGRAVSGPMILDTGSIIAINSSLKAGTKVPDPADQASLISNSGIATLFNGYGDTGANAVYSLAGNLSIGTDEEILLTGKVTRKNGGSFIVSISGCDIEAVGEFEEGEEVVLCIRPENVTLSELPSREKTSARNVFPAKIERVVPMGLFHKVDLDCGFPLTAYITTHSLQNLSLEEGKEMRASFKATSIHALRRTRKE